MGDRHSTHCLYNKSVNAKNKSDHINHTYTSTTTTTPYNIYTYTISPGKKLTGASITQLYLLVVLTSDVNNVVLQ